MVQTLSKTEKFWYKFLNEEDMVHDQICLLDPLGFDNTLNLVHQFNKEGDIDGLVSMMYQYMPKPKQIELFGYNESIAVMRDLGILIGSMKRHGHEPISLVPELEYVLFELSEKTDLPPRDTLFHYTIWNPAGARMRTYTGSEDEIELINSVKESYHPLVYAIYLLMEMHNTKLDDTYFMLMCIRAEKCFQGMVNGIINAKKKVSPAYFANELRFYFDPIVIHKASYIGPGAVEMPVFVYDHLLWSSDTEDEVYKKFKTTYLPFNLSYLRDAYYNYDGKESIVSKMHKALADRAKYDAEILKNNARALLNLCMTMKRFRMPHKKLANEAYKQQKDRSTGSGGYSPDILSHIIELNLQQIFSLDKAINAQVD